MVQFNGDRDFGETAVNAERLLGYIETAAANGAQMVVLPEGSLHGYATESEVWCRPGLGGYAGRDCRSVEGTAESVPGGAMVMWFGGQAARLNVRIVYSTIEKDGSRYYNTVVLVGPDGYEAKYRKRALYYLDQGYASSVAKRRSSICLLGQSAF
jgi:predicted amidohydrolase